MKRHLYKEQLDLQHKIQAEANVNVVTCGHCGVVILHDRDKSKVTCFSCDKKMDVSYCPDYFYEGEYVHDSPSIEETREFLDNLQFNRMRKEELDLKLRVFFDSNDNSYLDREAKDSDYVFKYSGIVDEGYELFVDIYVLPTRDNKFYITEVSYDFN